MSARRIRHRSVIVRLVEMASVLVAYPGVEAGEVGTRGPDYTGIFPPFGTSPSCLTAASSIEAQDMPLEAEVFAGWELCRHRIFRVGMSSGFIYRQ